jgi:hypothetical protein
VWRWREGLFFAKSKMIWLKATLQSNFTHVGQSKQRQFYNTKIDADKRRTLTIFAPLSSLCGDGGRGFFV